MPNIAFRCELCHAYVTVELSQVREITCSSCHKSWPIEIHEAFFQNCPLCQCRQFYTQKDFNRAAGCLIMAIGIVLVPFTYGLSLPLFFLLDWALHRKIPTMIVCYRCGAEFRGFSIPSSLKNFMHHIGEKYEKEKNKKS